MSDRCEPPPELRSVDGWHWVVVGDAPEEIAQWFAGIGGTICGWWMAGNSAPQSQEWIEDDHGEPMRYLSPVATPAEVEVLRTNLERERMRLAACGVVALSDTPESAARERMMHPDYRSASCDDVARRVDECMSLRARVAELEKALECIANWCEAYPIGVFPQSNADAALASCKAAGIPVDAMHGTWARRLLTSIGRDARAALSPATEAAPE